MKVFFPFFLMRTEREALKLRFGDRYEEIIEYIEYKQHLLLEEEQIDIEELMWTDKCQSVCSFSLETMLLYSDVGLKLSAQVTSLLFLLFIISFIVVISLFVLIVVILSAILFISTLVIIFFILFQVFFVLITPGFN